MASCIARANSTFPSVIDIRKFNRKCETIIIKLADFVTKQVVVI